MLCEYLIAEKSVVSSVGPSYEAILIATSAHDGATPCSVGYSCCAILSSRRQISTEVPIFSAVSTCSRVPSGSNSSVPVRVAPGTLRLSDREADHSTELALTPSFPG